MKKLVADDETHGFGRPKMVAFCDFPPPGTGMVMEGGLGLKGREGEDDSENSSRCDRFYKNCTKQI